MTDTERKTDAPAATEAVELDAPQLDQVAGGVPAVQAPATHTTLDVGSHSSGAGAGKVTFNPF